jgi:cytokinesis protein
VTYNRPKTHNFLQLILILGNFLNGSGHRGGAFGIKLESINKLADTKSEGATPTLLHYITKVVQQKFADLAYFLIELRPVEEAEKGL